MKKYPSRNSFNIEELFPPTRKGQCKKSPFPRDKTVHLSNYAWNLINENRTENSIDETLDRLVRETLG